MSNQCGLPSNELTPGFIRSDVM